jgi:hypothetical protein
MQWHVLMLTAALAASLASPAAAQRGTGTMVVHVHGKTLTFTDGECGFGPTVHEIHKSPPFDPQHPDRNLAIFMAAIPTPASRIPWATVVFTENGIRLSVNATGQITQTGGTFSGTVHRRTPGEPVSGSFTCTFPSAARPAH